MPEKPIRFSDVLEEMIKRGNVEEVLSYQFFVFSYLSLYYGISEERIMTMSNDEVVRLLITPPRPLKYRNWDTFYWGEAAFADPHD